MGQGWGLDRLRALFAERFEPKDTGYLYRRSSKGAPICFAPASLHDFHLAPGTAPCSGGSTPRSTSAIVCRRERWGGTMANHTSLGIVSGLVGASLMCGTAMAAATPGVTTLANPGGGTIAYARLPQQHTAQGAMGKVLQYATSSLGARPDVDKVMKSPDGNSLAVTFTVSPKGKPQMAGLALVAVSAAGPGAGAVLSDTADHLRTSLKPMLATLQDVATKAGAAGAQAAIANASGSAAPSASPSSSASAAQPATKSGATSASSAATANNVAANNVAANDVKATAPPQKLIQTNFPDGAGSVGLPAGWKITNSHQGDILAQGPNGEKMRFGMMQQALDYRNPQSRVLGRGPGGTAPTNFVAIPFGTPGDVAYKQVLVQLAQKARKPPPTIEYTMVKPLNSLSGGTAYLLQANVSDPSGPTVSWIQLFESTMGPMGMWTLTIYEVTVPKALAGQEMATALAMIPTYKTNDAVIMGQIRSDENQVQQITKNFLRSSQAQLDASARSTQATTDYLLGQTVVSDSALNGHGRVDDDVAAALIAANPNRFQAVSSSGYVRGIDY